MHPRPNKFFSVLFSFIPGAGHMYIGLMKRGASFMASFFLSIVCTIFLGNSFLAFNLETAVAFLIPLVWFVSFFDFWQFPRMSNEERLAVKDEFLLLGQFDQLKHFVQGLDMCKVRVIAGVLLIIGGISQLFRRFVMDFMRETYWKDNPRIQEILDMLPQIGAAALLIIVGILLILWKGRQIRKEAQAAAYIEAQEEAYDEE